MTPNPNPPAQTPEEVAAEVAKTFYEPPSTLNRYYLERLIAAALRAAAQAERERCIAWVKHESEIAEALNDYVGALRLAKAADRLESEWHLSPAPEGT